MGVETAVGLGLSALAAGANARNQQVVADKQDRAAAAGITQQAQDQQKANQQVAQTVQSTANSTPATAQKASLDAFLGELQSARAQSSGGGNTVGGTRFTTDKNAATQDVNDYGARTADLVSRINAPALQRQGEQQNFAQLGSDIGAARGQSSSDAFLEQLRQRSIQANPWATAGASVLGGVGQGLSSYAGANPKKSPGTVKSGNYDVPQY